MYTGRSDGSVFVVLVIVMVRKTKITKWVVQIGAVAGSMALIVSSGQMVWNELDVGEYLENQDTISMFLQENYMDPALVPVTFPEQKRNLVYILWSPWNPRTLQQM